MILKRLGVLSVGKISGAVYGGLGLVVGAFISLLAMIGASLGGGPGGGAFAAMLGVGAIIIFPLVYGTVGFLGGLLMALIYNLAARLVGGVEIETA